jgi:hypothetical protein
MSKHRFHSSPNKGATYTFATLADIGVFFAECAARAKANKSICRTQKELKYQDGMARAYEDCAAMLRAMEEEPVDG